MERKLISTKTGKVVSIEKTIGSSNSYCDSIKQKPTCFICGYELKEYDYNTFKCPNFCK